MRWPLPLLAASARLRCLEFARSHDCCRARFCRELLISSVRCKSFTAQQCPDLFFRLEPVVKIVPVLAAATLKYLVSSSGNQFADIDTAQQFITAVFQFTFAYC